MAERKVMVGPRVRRMRLERGLTQKQMAEELGISTSYLNLIERNQRPVTVQLLLKLGQSYDIDLQRFAVDILRQHPAILADPLGQPDGVIALARADIGDGHASLDPGELHHRLGFAAVVTRGLGRELGPAQIGNGPVGERKVKCGLRPAGVDLIAAACPQRGGGH